MRRIIIILMAVVALSSCFKDETYDTTLNIKCMEQLESGGETLPLNDVVAYLFEANSGLSFDSYDSALAGVATNASGAMVEAIGSARNVDSRTLLQVSGLEQALVVVVDVKNRIYTSATLDIGLNLPTTYISLEFRVWQQRNYTQGKWSFVMPERIDAGGDVDIEDVGDGGSPK